MEAPVGNQEQSDEQAREPRASLKQDEKENENHRGGETDGEKVQQRRRQEELEQREQGEEHQQPINKITNPSTTSPTDLI